VIANASPLPLIDEIQALLSAAAKGRSAPDVKDIVSLVVFTCLGPGELRELRWGQVDLTNRWMLVESKGYVRQVPFGNTVLRILEARKERQPDSEFVLGSSPKGLLHRVSHQLRTLSKGICKSSVNLRSLRCTFMSRWVNSGGNIHSLCYIAGYRATYSSMRMLLARERLYRVGAEHQRRLEEEAKDL